MSNLRRWHSRFRPSIWVWMVGTLLILFAVIAAFRLAGERHADVDVLRCERSNAFNHGSAHQPLPDAENRSEVWVAITKPDTMLGSYGPPVIAAVVAFALAAIVYWFERNHLNILMKREVAIEMHALFCGNELERARRQAWLWLMQDTKQLNKRLKSFSKYVVNPVHAGRDPEFLENCQALSTVLHFWGGIETLLADRAINETLVRSLFASRFRSWYKQVILPAHAIIESRVDPGVPTGHLPVWCEGTPLLKELCLGTSQQS